MASKRRRGRPRKNGPRHTNGHLKRQPADSPRALAARMPHRRGLGDHALDQNAENELGRMVLRGELDATQALAGETYARLWRGYLTTLDAPRWPWRGQGRETACAGCPTAKEKKTCACDRLLRLYVESRSALWSTGGGAAHLVQMVAIEGLPCAASCLDILRSGLNALVQYYGLTSGGRQWKKSTKARGRNLLPVPSHLPKG